MQKQESINESIAKIEQRIEKLVYENEALENQKVDISTIINSNNEKVKKNKC